MGGNLGIVAARNLVKEVLLFPNTPIALIRSFVRNPPDAARERVYAAREAVDLGGLASYGVNLPNLSRATAVYLDRILKGTAPADLPVQQPTKFELVINLRSAKSLGLELTASLLATADEVIE